MLVDTHNGARGGAGEAAPAEPKGAKNASYDAAGETGAEVGPQVIYRDPADVRTVMQLVSAVAVLMLMLLLSVCGNFYMYLRRPDRIVVDRTSGRTIMINDREFGETEAVQLGPDRLTDQDKRYVVGEFVKALYKIDPTTRASDLERALRMMVPMSAQKFSIYLRDQRVLERQRNESWQAAWTPQSIELDTNNKFIARVIGKQDISRVEGGQVVEETRQLQLMVKLIADPRGRADANLRSGFQIASIDYKELN